MTNKTKNMASVVASGLFNAVAFAGAGYLFSHFNKNGYEKEMKRHNEAMEKLSKAKEAWYEKQVETKNKLQKLRQEMIDAGDDMDKTNSALHAFRTILDETKDEPKLEHFYKPSNEMKSYMNMSKGVMGLGLGYLASKLIL